MIPNDALLEMLHPSPPLLNEERPFLVTTESRTSIPPCFREALAAAVKDGTAAPRNEWTGDEPVPSFDGRCFDDPVERKRLDDGPARRHQILIDWRAEDRLIAVTGMRRGPDGGHELVENSGRPVPDRDAVRRIAEMSARIAVRVLTTPSIDLKAMEDLDRLLAAFGAASCTMRDDESILVTAPTPWSMATIRRYSDDAGRTCDITDIDPAVEAVLPSVVEVSVTNDPNDACADVVRMDGRAVSFRHCEMPSSMETARLLAAGWPA